MKIYMIESSIFPRISVEVIAVVIEHLAKRITFMSCAIYFINVESLNSGTKPQTCSIDV